MFALTAAMAKVAVTEYHVLQILFFRQVVVFFSSLPSITRSFPQSLKTEHPKLHCLRLTGAFVALTCSIWALAVLPLTTAITLGFAKIFFVAILAKLALNESISPPRVVAVCVGFMGVVVVMRPGVDGLIDSHAVIPVIGALGAAVAVISVRKLSQTESTATLLVYQAVFVGVLAGIPLLGLWVTPDLPDLFFLLAMGVLATIGQWVGVHALRLGEASVVGNIEYVYIIYAALLGYFVFAEIPDSYTVLGALIIIGSSAYMLQQEYRSKQ